MATSPPVSPRGSSASHKILLAVQHPLGSAKMLFDKTKSVAECEAQIAAKLSRLRTGNVPLDRCRLRLPGEFCCACLSKNLCVACL